MTAYKLPSALFAEEVLFPALAFFPVPGYIMTVAMRAIDVYGYFHSFIVSSFVLFVIPRSFIHHTFYITSQKRITVVKYFYSSSHIPT
jgi:hypothetical protein